MGCAVDAAVVVAAVAGTDGFVVKVRSAVGYPVMPPRWLEAVVFAALVVVLVAVLV